MAVGIYNPQCHSFSTSLSLEFRVVEFDNSAAAQSKILSCQLFWVSIISFQFPIFNFKPTISSFLFLQWFNSNVWPQMGKRFCWLLYLLLTLGERDRGSKIMNLALSNANGHITLNTPVLVRSLKLSNVESSQYLDG